MLPVIRIAFNIKILLMLKTACLCTFLIFSHVALAQANDSNTPSARLTPVTNTITHKIGNKNIQIITSQYGEKNDFVFIALHDNEFTGLETAKSALENIGGLLIKIENDDSRNITFRLDGRSFTFDPNRMFSKTGIKKTLQTFGRSNERAINEVDRFAKRIVQLLPKTTYCIVAIHDNTDGEYSVSNYQKGGRSANDARLVTVEALQDPDDFFLTTDSLVFQHLSSKKYNVVLQHNLRVKEDGSLSVYCAKKNLRYLNCETEHGKSAQFDEMMEVAMECLQEMRLNN